jgi:hypothetical protein
VKEQVRQAQVINDLAGNVAGDLVVHAAAIAWLQDYAPDDKLHVKMRRPHRPSYRTPTIM